MSRRDLLLVELAARITVEGARRVAIDGVDGAGKTTFADDLAAALGTSHARVQADDHLNPPQVRHARGRDDPAGFWLDSYDLESLRCAVDSAGPCVVDGLFLHRDELVGLWDFSIWLEVPFAVSVGRLAVRDGSSPDPDDASQRRYVDGQLLYFAACEPWTRASLVVENSDVESPMLVEV